MQWWSSLGGLHGLASKPTGRLPGKQLEGRHSEGWLNHAADLAKVLDAPLATRWEKLARESGIATDRLPKADARPPRGDWIRTAFALVR